PLLRRGGSVRPGPRDGTAGENRLTRSKETTNRGSSQATRLTCPQGRAPRPPCPERAAARGGRPLPRAQAAPPRLPELRLVQRPPGDRPQAAVVRVRLLTDGRPDRPHEPGRSSSG